MKHVFQKKYIENCHERRHKISSVNIHRSVFSFPIYTVLYQFFNPPSSFVYIAFAKTANRALGDWNLKLCRFSYTRNILKFRVDSTVQSRRKLIYLRVIKTDCQRLWSRLCFWRMMGWWVILVATFSVLICSCNIYICL